MSEATLRLKMCVGSVRRSADGDGKIISEEINLNAVYGTEGSANGQWSKWTPSASLTMIVTNPSAFNRALPGQFYHVELLPTDKDSL